MAPKPYHFRIFEGWVEGSKVFIREIKIVFYRIFYLKFRILSINGCVSELTGFQFEFSPPRLSICALREVLLMTRSEIQPCNLISILEHNCETTFCHFFEKWLHSILNIKQQEGINVAKPVKRGRYVKGEDPIRLWIVNWRMQLCSLHTCKKKSKVLVSLICSVLLEQETHIIKANLTNISGYSIKKASKIAFMLELKGSFCNSQEMINSLYVNNKIHSQA